MARIKSYDYLYKVLLIGDGDVGKTELLFRLCDPSFNLDVTTSIGIDFKIKTVSLDRKILKFQIWDTAGQERFHTVTTSYYRGAHGILLVFDPSNKTSFANLKKWLENIKEHAKKGAQVLVLENSFYPEIEREVSRNELTEFARQNGVQGAEVSSKTGQNVHEAFLMLAERIYQHGLGNLAVEKDKDSSEIKIEKKPCRIT